MISVARFLLALGGGALVGSIGVGAVAWADRGTDAGPGHASKEHVVPAPAGLDFDKSLQRAPVVNQFGLSVGQMYAGRSLPDLVPVRGGYIRPAEYLLPPGVAGSEAQQMDKSMRMANGDIYVNVYEADGVTVVGRMLIGNAISE